MKPHVAESADAPGIYPVAADQIHPGLRSELYVEASSGHPFVVYDRATSKKVDELMTKLEEIDRQLQETGARISKLEKATGVLAPVQLRDLSDEDAKLEIKSFFEKHHGKTLFPDEVADALDLDVLQVIRLCRELEGGGEIAEAEAH